MLEQEKKVKNMRLIDADALLAEYDRQHDGEPGKARKLIEDAPTIDRPTRSQFKRMAVQLGYEAVVRCKECKHLMFSDCYGECGAGRMGIVSPYDFCSHGEWKSNGNEDRA